MNISINLQNIINEKIEILVKEYKDLAIKHINYLNQKNIQQLDNLFSFSNINNTINNEIDNMYNNKLLHILKEKAIYYSGDNGIKDYDLPNTTLADINSFIEAKINQTKTIINKMKGNEFNIKENWKKSDFSKVKNNEFLIIKNAYNNFTEIYQKIEKNEFNKAILENMNTNFKLIIQNFIPSFGKDFFYRIVKYNGIQKIKSLYNNLKYSLAQTFNYNLQLLSLNLSTIIPEELKTKLLSINNVDILINSLNNDAIIKINNKLNKLFEETKDYIVDKYTYYIKVDPSIILNIDNDIKNIIDDLIDDNRETFENEYINLININIKNSFIEEYKEALNEETENIINFIEENKKLMKEKLDSLNVLKTDDILLDIENKLNNLIKTIDNYDLFFNSFEISEDIPILLNNYCKETILPYYKEIKFILDNSTKIIVTKNIDNNKINLKNSFKTNNFESKSNNIIYNLEKTYFNNMINYLKHSYGSISSKYLPNLDKEIIKFQNLRILNDLNNGRNINKRNIGDLKLDETLKLIKNSSSNILLFINNLNLFADFRENINNYLNEINEQYILSKDIIKNLKYNKTTNEKLNQDLDELKNDIINYYISINSSYYQTKEYIKNYFIQVNDLIDDCANITYKEINKKYFEIKNNFNSIKNKKIEEKLIEIDNHNENVDEMKYIIKTKIDKYLIENEISLDIVFEEGEEGDIIIPKIIGKIINNNHPKKMVIDFYSNYGQNCQIKGRKMTINFNNISFISDFIFDSSLNNVTINHYINFDEYNIKSEKYTIKEENFIKNISGMSVVFPKLCKSSLDGEYEIKTCDAIKNNSTEIYEY